MALRHDILGEPTQPIVRAWTDRDALLYALAVGAGAADPLNELAYTTENTQGVDQQVIPTFGCLLAAARSPRKLGDFDIANLVHAEQAVEFHAPIPASGEVSAVSTLTRIADKGKAALLTQKNVATAGEKGEALVTSTAGFFVRGEGGFGGERGEPAPSWDRPDGPATRTVIHRTRKDQSLLYRLTGDRNPLHSDPSVARRAGFSRPILHGMCTFGFACRALLEALCGADPRGLKSMAARFSRPVLPGTELVTHVWDHGGSATFVTLNGDGDVVLDRGTATYSPMTP